MGMWQLGALVVRVVVGALDARRSEDGLAFLLVRGSKQGGRAARVVGAVAGGHEADGCGSLSVSLWGKR